ncbi:lactosylceramide 1,3-N-acetyl-beta-D-glucosaminyltransferase isoform X8 [Motacilla alba alba]|uniref:lactosylceramide 1,3-N-acetyl-beta-D-glucosaminyltransferase isoform X8 n=1 Tax=Motacilla alba alba TaxID=1094192 RepID=UPI0018D54E62|nr:lactosylceramide 1,3-N-acetyl-beta-D-glucosaminyltransferase isoform X8 [Motacilla alba alba]
MGEGAVGRITITELGAAGLPGGGNSQRGKARGGGEVSSSPRVSRSWKYPEMRDAGASNRMECKTMIRSPVTILTRQGSAELELAGVHLHEGKKHED